MAASVWIALPTDSPESDSMMRSSALITPVVSVRSRPKGLPIASTRCPTRSVSEAPSGSGATLSWAGSTRSTARS